MAYIAGEGMTMPDSIITPNKLKFHVFRDERFIDLNLYQF